ncbi:aKG-HExxH-type peptide beta-hydroxylase [Streptomyces salinarius]|uniref:aKG-HExxH-type peptide beta-hydroxylase n=1 Tax=Streptomyces salinarius TaxID=2762598 RepID=UPI0016477038|nr:HEXXH motif-containing putative peptide modification protein [Streptomyces salinarius]
MAISPSEILSELASTRPRPAAVAALRAAVHARRMLLVKSLLVRVDRHSTAMAPTAHRRFERDWETLERTERADPAAVRDVLDYPMTGIWLTEALAAPLGTEFEAHLAHLSGVSAAAVVRAGCEADRTLTAPAGVLTLPGIGVLSCPSGRARLVGRDGRVRVEDERRGAAAVLFRPGADGRPVVERPEGEDAGWSGLRTFPGGTVVLEDLDPYRVPAPGIGPSALPAARCLPSARALWFERWRAAQTFMSAADPARAAEIGAVLRAVVPLASPQPADGAPVSATLRAAPCAVLTQLPAGGRELAESLVHETHHTKLAALNELLPLCRPDGTTLHHVGWRPDPRPVPAVLQGAYAHLALTDLSSRMLRGRVLPSALRRWAAEQFPDYREQVGTALSILRESDELTSAGREFVQRMVWHHESLGVMVRSCV